MNYDEVLNFLNYIYEFYPDLNSGGVYNILCNYGLTEDNKTINIKKEGYFDYFISRVSNTFKHTRAFCDEKWGNFCQFENINKKDSKRYIKVYIPIKYSHVLKSTIKIFDFLDSNDIFHRSKISDVIRSDNVVIRLEKGDFDSLKKLFDFIESDDYIKKGLNKCNPFVPTNWTKSGIGVLDIDADVNKSYNETISECVAEYIHYQRGASSKFYRFMKNKKENPNPEAPTVEGFYKYTESNHRFLSPEVREQTLNLLKNSLLFDKYLDDNNKKRI